LDIKKPALFFFYPEKRDYCALRDLFERDYFRLTLRDESFSLFFCGQYLLFIVLDLIAGFSLFGKAIRSLWNRFVCPAEADREDLSNEQT
jgi:hypothetical protein